MVAALQCNTNDWEEGDNPMENKKHKILWGLFVIFFKAGTFTFAGGLAMLPVIEKDVTEKYKLMGKEEFMEYATLAQTLPGVIALNCACFVGKRAAGALGMLVASIGATFSAFFLMLLATIAMQHVPQSGPAVGALSAIRAASAALILSAAISLGTHNLKSAYAVIVMIASFVLVFFFKVSTPFVVLAAAIAGVSFYKRPSIKKEGGNA